MKTKLFPAILVTTLAVAACSDNQSKTDTPTYETQVQAEENSNPDPPVLERKPHEKTEASLSKGYETVQNVQDMLPEETLQVLLEYSIPKTWFTEQKPIVKENILKKRFYWGPAKSGLTMGVLNSDDRFVTWEGAKPFNHKDGFLVIGESLGKRGVQTSIKF